MRLVLEDGSEFRGRGFGAEGVATAGEVVFNTAMSGYVEALTDPSYRGQILVLTYPLQGNYGVPAPRLPGSIDPPYESDRIQVQGLVVQRHEPGFSHHAARRSLSAWLRSEDVPAIAGVDTRALTRRLRESGTMAGVLKPDAGPASPTSVEMTREVFELVAPRAPRRFGAGSGPEVLLLDVGAKDHIVRSARIAGNAGASRLGLQPFAATAREAAGIAIGNGPGDPAHLGQLAARLADVMTWFEGPILGICLGNQVLARAAGGAHIQAAIRTSRGQPAGARPRDRTRVHHQPQPRLRRGRGEPSGRLGPLVPQSERRHQRRHPGARPAVSQPAVPPRSAPGARGYGGDLRRVRGLMPGPVSGEASRRRAVLVLGSGALQIGQAGEFDYSGSQAIKAFSESGLRTVLVNPNVATIQTSEGMADRLYLNAVTPKLVRDVALAEGVDCASLSFGGQTALNCGLELEGFFEERGIEVLGTAVRVIRDTEDRGRFKARLAEIGVKTARSRACSTLGAARDAAEEIGLPLMLRAGFALGGRGSAIVETRAELESVLTAFFSAHDRAGSQILVEESLRGWKEIEYEVVRDREDNCITVCNMENMDPMGIHTGESFVVAPSQTLNDEEYQLLRTVSIRTIRHLGIIGECNVQFALDPHSADYRVIEVNARLSRSSALASKATGYPLAYIAAKLAVGATLPELRNEITGVTSAFFEPALDYLTLKAPRWDLGKFQDAGTRIGSEMKSVGEVMAIGRTFPEVLQKALRMLDVGVRGLDSRAFGFEDVEDELRRATPPPRLRPRPVPSSRRGRGTTRRGRGTGPRPHPDRPLVPSRRRGDGADGSGRGVGGGEVGRPRRAGASRGQGARVLGRIARCAHRPAPGRDARGSPAPRRRPADREDRHPRRRVPGAHQLPLLDLPRVGRRGGRRARRPPPDPGHRFGGSTGSEARWSSTGAA